MRFAYLFFLIILSSACSDPLAIIPGGKLGGVETAVPPDWQNVPDVIQVETRPADPYSINIWGVGIGEHLYIATGEDGTAWSEFILDDPAVKVRMGDKLYVLKGVLVSDSAERAEVASAYVKKYELDLDDNWVKSGMIFRFDR